MAASSPGEPRIKGGILLSRMKFVRERGGDAALEDVLNRLDQADQAVLRGPMLHVVWYPLELNLRLDDAIADVLSPGDRRRVFLDMGRASAEVNLAGPHKPYVRVGNPHHLLSQAPKIYASYYGVGHRTYEQTGDKSGVLRTFEAENVTATDCLTVVGWYERAIEFCGGKNVVVEETRCRARGEAHCEYHCRWD